MLDYKQAFKLCQAFFLSANLLSCAAQEGTKWDLVRGWQNDDAWPE
jgi:hypothetical protein